MKTVSASDAKQGFAAVLDAAQREPVIIKRQKREVAVVLSFEDYKRLSTGNVEEFEKFCDMIGTRAQKRGMTAGRLKSLLGET